MEPNREKRKENWLSETKKENTEKRKKKISVLVYYNRNKETRKEKKIKNDILRFFITPQFDIIIRSI
jgi:hypothetical protein